MSRALLDATVARQALWTRRRQLVLPFSLLDALVELLTRVKLLCDAAGVATDDNRWCVAADKLDSVCTLLREPLLEAAASEARAGLVVLDAHRVAGALVPKRPKRAPPRAVTRRTVDVRGPL